MLKRIVGGIASAIAICIVMAISYGLYHHNEPNTYDWSIPEVFIFYMAYILPPLLVGGVFFSSIIDAITQKIQKDLSSLQRYSINFTLYVIFGMLGGVIYIGLIMGGREPFMGLLYGALASILFFHTLMLLRTTKFK